MTDRWQDVIPTDEDGYPVVPLVGEGNPDIPEVDSLEATEQGDDSLLGKVRGAAGEVADTVDEAVRYYGGPTGIPERATQAAELFSPVTGITDAMGKAGDGDYTDAALETAYALAPGVAGATARGLARGSAAVVDDVVGAGRDVADSLLGVAGDASKSMYDGLRRVEFDTNTVGSNLGSIKIRPKDAEDLEAMEPEVYNSLVGHNGGPTVGDVSSVDLPPGNKPRYRGAAENRTTPYLRYRPKNTTGRMERLATAISDVNNPINKIFDNYISKGQTLNGSDWYNTEELRDWMVSRLGKKEGDLRWREYMELVGTTSTGAKVPENIRMASFYNALNETDRLAVAKMVSEGGITPLAAAKKLGVEPAHAPTNYNYGHMKQQNQGSNVVNHTEGRWDRTMPEGLTKGQQTEWLKKNPKVKGFANDLLGDDTNIAADMHFMRMLAMADGGGDFLNAQAKLSAENTEILKSIIGPRKIKKYMKTRKVDGKPVTEINLYKAWQDGHIKDTSELQQMPTAWADTPKDNEYAAYEDMAASVAKRYDMTPHQFQANLWMGAGDLTGLADASQGTFMDLFRRALDKRAAERGIPRKEMLIDFIDNRALLQVPLAGGAATGAGLMSQQEEEY